MNKIAFCKIFLFLLICNFLIAQEIPYHKKELKYNFEALLSGVPEHNFDVIHYQFDWKIDFDSQYIRGKTVVKARSLINNLNKITIHLADNMNVTKIKQNQIPVDFIHHNNLLDIYLVKDYYKNEEFEVEIFYNGHPQDGLNFSYHQNHPIIWNLDEPIGARYWFPCYDHPSDKATAEMRITVPANMIVASNGSLVNFLVNNDNTVTYVWKEDYPIATYLISIAATNYEVFRDYYSSDLENMEVVYFVYPEDLFYAQEDFSVTPSMIEFFSRVFGEYPFLKEKYGMAEIPGSTAMEHQTCTSFPFELITGTHEYDWIIAHELAHQWWGDLVTLGDWVDIWLNEGFATYSDALWHEYIYGIDGLNSRMSKFKNMYFSHKGSEHPIYNPPQGHLFCSIEYEKGAWVLHMLRFVVGDSKFWNILKEYAKLYAYDNATTEDFQLVCEQVYGGDLDWFFNQWIYQAGYPTYQFGWGFLGEGKVRVIINQVQENFPLFKMPIELQFVFPSEKVKKLVWVEEGNNIFDFSFEEKPLEVLFDPDNWILCKVEDYYKKGNARK